MYLISLCYYDNVLPVKIELCRFKLKPLGIGKNVLSAKVYRCTVWCGITISKLLK